MEIKLQLFLILGTALYGFVLLLLLKRGSLNLKYSLLWILSVVCMLIAAIFPGIVIKIASFVGITTPSNMVFVMWGILVLFILISITVIVSKITRRIYTLTQSQALLEKRVRDLEASLKLYEHRLK